MPTSKKAVRPKQKRKPRKKTQGRKRHRNDNFLVEFLVSISLSFIFCLLIAAYFFKISVIDGYGMMPTLRAQDIVLINKTKEVRRFDVVLLRLGNTYQVRRVIGFPDESLAYKNDDLFIDGEMVYERFISQQVNEAQRNGGNYTKDFQLTDIDQSKIGENEYFVLGDNREYCIDSRQYGFITEEQIVGVVQAKIF